MNRHIGRVRQLRTGRALPYTRAGSLSAIDKQPRQGPVLLGPLGLEGDEQGSPEVHGGPHKALHCYAWSQYALWRAELAGHALAQQRLTQPGAFGENLSIDGVDESSVCIADRWRIGAAVVEVSQGRQPCWKLDDRFGVAGMALRVQQSLRCGWYLRVLEPGALHSGDAITLLARPHPDWPLLRLLRAIAQRSCAPELMQQILALPLPPSWHKLFARRLASGAVEDWAPRLQG